MTRRPAARTLLAVAAAATLGLTACGGDDSEGEETTSESSETSEESETSEDEESAEEESSEPAEESPSEEESAPAEESPSEEPSLGESPSVDSSVPAVDPSAPSADPSADPSDPANGTGMDQALAAELEPMALTAEDVPGGSGQGQSQFIPEAQGQPLHMTLTGLEATGECKTAVDTLNSGERLPEGSQFTITQLSSGAQVQVGVVKMAGAKQVGEDVAAIAEACDTIEGPGGTATVESLPSDNGYVMSLENAGQSGGFSMGVDAVGPEHAAVVLAVSEGGALDASEVGAVLDKQVEQATSNAPQG
ncbi:hypothetical protein [Kytococcus sedentarius]|uniref:hypothetical protein n=1 Tax=Kytococcus sedentarius TaxID=1276 RepID=UPI0035BC876D